MPCCGLSICCADPFFVFFKAHATSPLALLLENPSGEETTWLTVVVALSGGRRGQQEREAESDGAFGAVTRIRFKVSVRKVVLRRAIWTASY